MKKLKNQDFKKRKKADEKITKMQNESSQKKVEKFTKLATFLR